MKPPIPGTPWIYPVLSAAAVIGTWYAAPLWLDLPGYLLPLPHAIAAALIEEGPALARALRATGAAALTGLLLTASAGFLIAVALASSRVLRLSLYPYVLLLQMVPVIVLTPILVLWLGSGFPSVTAVTFLITFFPVVSNTVQGLLATPRGLVDLFRVQKATRIQEMFLLRVPHALPQYLAGLRIAATLAPVGAIAGEFFAGSGNAGEGGLGYLVIVYFSRHEIAALFATGFTACALGYLFVATVALLFHLSLRHWHESAQPHRR